MPYHHHGDETNESPGEDGEVRVMQNDSIVFAQVPLLKSQLDALKRRAGTTTTKDALQAAVTHYLRCPATQAPTSGEEGVKQGSRSRTSEKRVNEEDWWWSPEEKVEI